MVVLSPIDEEGGLVSIRRCTKKNSVKVEKRLYRFTFGLWGSVAVVALVAPWAYALSAVLFATFVTFAALEDG